MLLICTTVHASTEFEKLKETYCSASKSICIEGALKFDPSTGILTFTGHVKSVSGPGKAKIVILGNADINANRTFLGKFLSFDTSGVEDQKIILKMNTSSAKGNTDMIWRVSSVLYFDDTAFHICKVCLISGAL